MHYTTVYGTNSAVSALSRAYSMGYNGLFTASHTKQNSPPRRTHHTTLGIGKNFVLCVKNFVLCVKSFVNVVDGW